MAVRALGRRPLRPAAQGALFYFGFFGAAAAYMPFLSVFFAHRGLSGREIGVLAAIGPLMAFLVAPGLSALADRHNWRVRMLGLALAGTGLSLLVVPLPASFIGLLPIVTLLAAIGSPAGPLADGLLAQMAVRHGLAFGQMRLWGSLSWALMAAAGGLLWQQLGLTLMFPLACLLFLGTMLVTRLFDEEPAAPSTARPGLRMVTADVRLRVVLVATLLLGVALGMAGTFTGIYMDRLGGGQLLIGLLSGVTALSELPTMHWSEGLVRRIGGPRTLLLAYGLMGISYLGMAVIGQPVLLLGVGVVQGLGFGLFLPTTVRLVATWSPSEWSATFQSILSACAWGLAPLIAGPLGGVIYDTAGPAAVFLACTAAAAGAGAVLLGAHLGGMFKRAGDRYEVRQALPG